MVLPATSAFGKEENGRWPFRPYIQMLANNNISAGRVVTKMEFDINSPVPRLLFSPSAAVPPEMRDAITRQSKSAASDNAVKLTVYKSDSQGEEAAAPAQPEPVRRETAKPTVEAAENASEVIKKWTKK